MWVSDLFLPPLSRMFVRPSFLSFFPLSTANECDHTKLIGRPTSFLFFFLPHSTAFYLPFMSPISPPHQVRCLSNCVLIPERRGSGNESSLFMCKCRRKSQGNLHMKDTFSCWIGEIEDKNPKFPVHFFAAPCRAVGLSCRRGRRKQLSFLHSPHEPAYE